MNRRTRLFALLGLSVVGAVVVVRGLRDAAAWSATESLCRDGVGPDEVAALVARVPVDHPSMRDAAECACAVEALANRREDCFGRLATVLADPAAADWIPEPALTAAWLEFELARGGANGPAQALAERVLVSSADPVPLASAVALLLAVTTDQRALAARVDAAVARDNIAARIVLSEVFRRRRDGGAADLILGADPPDVPALRPPWFVARASARATLADADGAEDVLDAWQASGGDPDEIMAQRLFVLGREQLRPPRGINLVDAYERGIVGAQRSGPQPLLKYVYGRYVSALAIAGSSDEAIKVLERAKAAGVAPDSMTPELLQRSAEAARRERDGRPQTEVRRFALTLGGSAGTSLWVAHADDPVDAPYRRMKSGEVFPALVPARFVVRNDDGAVVHSGRVWSDAGDGVTTRTIEGVTAPVVVRPPPSMLARPADGRSRLFTVLLDCGDWRISRLLMERNELPVLSALATRGTTAVLWSSPAYTAEALDSIVYPSSALRLSVLATFHKMGDEIAGLASVGQNPWSALDQVLPERPNFFSTVGAGDRSAVNLLFTLGGQVQGGPRNGAVTGPGGAHTVRPVGAIARPVTTDEAGRHPLLKAEKHIEPIAAEFDLLDEEAERGRIDVVVMRIEALDLITHQAFVELYDEGTGDDALTLHAAYRYIDERVGAVASRLDADDILVVMSDHGIATGLKHDERAMWIVNGPGIIPRRLDGMPNLRGVPTALAGLAGVATDWPETGLGPRK